MNTTSVDEWMKLKVPEEEDERRHWDYHYDVAGAAPGTLVIDEDAAPTELMLIDYSAERATRQRLRSPEEAALHLDSESVSWIDLQGLGNEDVLNRLGEVFQLHPLVLEDVVNVPQRPKIEYYGDQLLIITRMVMLTSEDEQDEGNRFVSEQLSFVLGKNYLLTVQEEPEQDCLNAVRNRIRTGQGLIRTEGADYLAYALLDAVIDAYFPVLEDYGEYIESLEDEVIFNPTQETVQKIYRARRELMALRRSIWPQRNALSQLVRDGSTLISPEVKVYLQDCYDHVVQVLDIVETYRELTANLMDVYLSSVSNRMNEVMKTLTVISSIFIPLTFIVGVYGMNFSPQASPWNMPELQAYWGYPICWGVMIGIALSLSFYFWRKGWFSNAGDPTQMKISRR
ncbi:MAG: magnesium/cobalt transporter CorA [Cyanobacteria bacterium J06627_28]